MKAFDGFKSEASNNKGYPLLPAGPYVAKIIAVHIDGDEPDQRLILRLDIAEGPYANYYMDRYKAESEKKGSKYPVKYKGDIWFRIPNPDNKKAMYPESDKKRFNDMVYRIEQSNPGYHWDWNEQGLVGLVVGINMQEDSYNGNAFTKIGRLEIVSEVRSGTVQAMAPRQRQGDADDSQFVQTPAADQQAGFTAVETDELPF